MTEDVYRPLRQRYHFQCRGPITFKSHGEITTYYMVGRKSLHSPSPSSVSHVNMNDFSWFKRLSQTSGGGFQLEDTSGSLRSCGDGKVRLTSLNGSRDNIVPTLVPSLGRSRIPSDSVRGAIGATPPGSLTRKQQQQQQQHRNNKNSDSRENVNRGHRKLSNTSLTSNDFTQRVGSPELPLVHFRNFNLPGGSSLPRADNNYGMNTLTQAAFMSSVQENRGANSGSKQIPDSPRSSHNNIHKLPESPRGTHNPHVSNSKMQESPRSTLNQAAPSFKPMDSPHLQSVSAPQIWNRSESPKILNGLLPPLKVQSSPKVNNAIQVQRSTDSPKVKTNGSFRSMNHSSEQVNIINNKGYGSGGRKKNINMELLQQNVAPPDGFTGIANRTAPKNKVNDCNNTVTGSGNLRFGGVPLERVSESPTPDSTPHGSPEKMPLNLQSMQPPMRCRGGGIVAAQDLNFDRFKTDVSDPNVLMKDSCESPSKMRPKKAINIHPNKGNNSPENIVAHKPPMHKQGSRSPEEKLSPSPHIHLNNPASPDHSSSSTSSTSSSSECTSSNISTPESLGPNAVTSPLYASNPLYGELPATPNNKRIPTVKPPSPVVKEVSKPVQQKVVSRIPVRQSAGVCISNPMNVNSPTEKKLINNKNNNNNNNKNHQPLQKQQPKQQQLKKETKSEIPKRSKLARLTKQQSLPETYNLDKVVSANAKKFGTKSAGVGPSSKSSITLATSAESIGFRPITTSPQTESTPTTLCNSDDEDEGSPPPLPPPPSESALRGGGSGNITKPDPLHSKLLAYHKPDYPVSSGQNGKSKLPVKKPPLPPSSIPMFQCLPVDRSYKNHKTPSPRAESPSPSSPLIPLSPTKTNQPPTFQVKRRQPHKAPLRYCRSLDYIPSDLEDAASEQTSPMHSPKQTHDLFPSAPFLRKYFLPDNLSLSSLGSSEMSRSDPAINYDSGSAAYESEYDNYRPGMASDEDYFVPEPISDMDIDIFDDINIDNVTVSDTYSVDMPLPRKKKVTDV